MSSDTGLELGLSLVAELVVERLQRLGVVSLFGPHHGAVAVVIGDHKKIGVALAIADVVGADALEIVESGVVDLVGDHPHHDVRDRLPRASQ